MEANILGRGIDNHLIGLRESAREILGELPAFFNDDTYRQMMQFKLSTSQVCYPKYFLYHKCLNIVAIEVYTWYS